MSHNRDHCPAHNDQGESERSEQPNDYEQGESIVDEGAVLRIFVRSRVNPVALRERPNADQGNREKHERCNHAIRRVR